MDTVKWRLPGVFKGDANTVAQEITTIGDKVKSTDLVEYARQHPDSELHKCFEWDDTIAAEKFREMQGQKILRFLVVTPARKDAPAVRKYQITTERNTYSPTRSFLVNETEYETLLRRALAELRAFRERYKRLSELEAIFAEIDAL